MSDVKKKLREILPESLYLTQSIKEIGDDDDLAEAGMDSLGFVTLVIDIEDGLGITFPSEKFVLPLANTINKLTEIVETELGKLPE